MSSFRLAIVLLLATVSAFAQSNLPLLGVGGVASGAPTITVAHATSSTCSTTSHCAITIPSTTSGNLLVAMAQFGNQGVAITTCDGGSCSTSCTTSTDTFNTLASNPVSDGLSGGNEINGAYTIVSSGITSVSFCSTGNHTWRVAVLEYHVTTSWKALASVLDHSSTGTGSGAGATSASPANITPTATNELLIGSLQTGQAITASSFTISGTGFAEQTAGGTARAGWASASRADSCQNLSSGNTSTTCTFSWTTTSGWSAILAAFAHN